MDKYYYFEKIQKERERDISNMFVYPRDNRREPLSRKQAQKLAQRLAFAVIVLSALLAFLM